MEIQVSLIIWTVICFTVLVLILKNWLFKPVLEVIDKRRKRIEDAAKKSADADKSRIEAEQQIEKMRNEYVSQKKKEIREQAEKVRIDGKKALEQSRTDRLFAIEKYREKTDAEYSRDIGLIGEDADKLAKAFADKMISH